MVQRTARPTGVIVICVVLGFSAAVLLLLALGSVASMAMAGHMPHAASTAPPPPPGVMIGIGIFTGGFYGALAAWAIATLVGLLHMKTWARFSAMVIAGGLALSNLLGALLMLVIGSTVIQTMAKAAAAHPNGASAPPPPTPILQGIFIGMAVFQFISAGLALCMFVYLLMRRTRLAFEAAAFSRSGYTLAHNTERSATYSLAESYATPGGLAALPPLPLPVQYTPAEYAPVATKPARPLPISIIGYLMIGSAVVSLPVVFLPMPLFFFGFVLSGMAGHALCVVLFLLLGLCGFGLLRLNRAAFFASLVYYGAGILQSLAFLVPAYHARFLAYLNALTTSLLGSAAMTPGTEIFTSGWALLPGVLLGALFCAAIVALLLHYRSAFEAPTDAADTHAAL